MKVLDRVRALHNITTSSPPMCVEDLEQDMSSACGTSTTTSTCAPTTTQCLTAKNKNGITQTTKGKSSGKKLDEGKKQQNRLSSPVASAGEKRSDKEVR